MRREHRHQMTDEERTALYARLDAATELERQMAEDVYVAKRQIVVGSTCYPRGSILPDDVARGLRNFQSLVDSRALMKSPYPFVTIAALSNKAASASEAAARC